MILGADPEELDQIAARISQRADAYEHSHQQITYWLNRLTWQGPDAHRFRAAYRSSMGPQLVHAAAALRAAASGVRSQAAHQRLTSTGASGVGSSGSTLAGVLGVAGLGAGGVAHGAMTLAEGQKRLYYPMMGLNLADIAVFAWMAKKSEAPAQLLFHAAKPDEVGLGRLLGGSTATALGWVGFGHAVLTMPGDVGDLSEDIGEFDWSDQDSIEQFFYSGTDFMVSTGSMLGVTPLAPAGLVLMSTGYVMKGGTAVLPPVVNWGVDNLVWPAWNKAGRPAWDFVSNTAQESMSWTGDRLHDAREFGEDAWKFITYDAPNAVGDVVGGITEGAGNVARDMGQQSQRWVDDRVDTIVGGVRGFLGF